MSAFADHFSRAAREYATYRPSYPPELFAWLAAQAPDRHLAWDCATGSGQAALGLALHFDLVVGTDASAAQVANAQRHPGVAYGVMMAEQAALRDGCASLVCVAQALHWFDRPRFYAEVRRVLQPGGVLAVWRYGLINVSPAVDQLIGSFHRETVGAFWPPERALVEAGYSMIEFPFEEIAPPSLVMGASWTLDQLGGYLGTWSAVSRYRSAHRADPVPALIEELLPVWGSPDAARHVSWPIEARAGRVANSSVTRPRVNNRDTL